MRTPFFLQLASVACACVSLACMRAESARAGPPACAGARPAQPVSAVRAQPTVTDSLLHRVADIVVPGPAARFDYQSVDTAAGRLYVAHMNAGSLLVFDTRARRVVADLPGFPSVHGVIAVPELGRVYATATGQHHLAVIDSKTLAVLARVGDVGYPDGLAYAPDSRRVYVSDESSAGKELVVDAVNNKVVGSIALRGEAGNTIYDPGSHCILVAVQTRNEIVAIDPRSDSIVGRYRLEGASHPHGLAVDAEQRLLFVANEGNAKLLVVDLTSMRVMATHDTGEAPDVLAFDRGLGRLYVACESGTVSIFRERGRELFHEGDMNIPRAHTVAVDPRTHEVYLPLENINGKPVLRIMRPY
jgi:DNA-binding beta-propeller fold protein YncE